MSCERGVCDAFASRMVWRRRCHPASSAGLAAVCTDGDMHLTDHNRAVRSLKGHHKDEWGAGGDSVVKRVPSAFPKVLFITPRD